MIKSISIKTNQQMIKKQTRDRNVSINCIKTAKICV